MSLDHNPDFRGSNSATGDIKHEGKNIFFAAVETTRMPMIVTDPTLPDNPIIFANRAFVDMTGYSAEEILDANCRFLQGTETDPDTVRAVREAIANEKEIAVELINYRKDGTAFWNALFISPVYSEDGRRINFFASQLDVSRRRDAEDGLKQAQKMEALGQLTGGIAHDFNNLLQVMLGYLDNIAKSASDPGYSRERIQKNAEHAKSAAVRAATLTQQLLAFSRKQTLTTRVLNLNTVVESSREMAGSLFDEIKLVTELEPKLWNCRLDPTQMDVSLLNVLVNAKDALVGRDDRRIVIKTENVKIGDDDILAYDGVRAGRYVLLSVTDNGIGVPSAYLDRVMDPFFTTKEEGQGTGLGLSMVYGFVKQSGGAARLTSEENVGTTLRLYFPADDSVPTPVIKAERFQSRGTERILIVDDRQDVAHLAELMLEDEGYVTEVVYNASQALEALEKSQYDLLFTDLIMPGGMNGVVLAREARRKYPSMKILLTTGYADTPVKQNDIGDGVFDVLLKPYLAPDLAKKVRLVLAGPTGVG